MPPLIKQAMQGSQGPQLAPQRAADSLQVAYERVVMAASKVLHQPQIIGEIVNMVRAHGDPTAGLADATVFIMKLLWQASKGTIPGPVIVPAGKEVMQMIATIVEHAGLGKVTPDVLQKAMGLAAAQVLKTNGVDQAKAQQLAQQSTPANFQPLEPASSTAAAPTDFKTAVLQHGAIPSADARGHLLMVGHDSKAHGYVLHAKTGRRLVVRTKRSKASHERVAGLVQHAIDLHQRATSPGVRPEKRKQLDADRLAATHRIIEELTGGR